MRKGDRIVRSFKDGRTQPQGFLEDHAFVVAGLLDLYEASFDRRWLGEALAIAEAQEKQFADPEGGGWFMTAGDAEKLLAREKPAYDGAEPSGTSVAILNALRLETFTTDDRWRTIAARGFASIAPVLNERPLAMTEALVALDFYNDVPREVGIVWGEGQPVASAEPLLAVLRATFLPSKALAGASAGSELTALATVARFMADKAAQGGKATGYVCERGRCELPTADPGVFREQLARVIPYPK
jgi:uncharacterized protein YyaL (SSP411 family)